MVVLQTYNSLPFTAGNYRNAGLPAIKGKIFGAAEGGQNFSNKAPRINIVTGSGGDAGNATNHYWDINKNWVESTNLIYGASNTVQPNSLTSRYYIKF